MLPAGIVIAKSSTAWIVLPEADFRFHASKPRCAPRRALVCVVGIILMVVSSIVRLGERNARAYNHRGEVVRAVVSVVRGDGVGVVVLQCHGYGQAISRWALQRWSLPKWL